MNVPIHYGPPPIGPEPENSGSLHGQAAMLLVESLMHTLVEKKIISRNDFIEIVDGATEVEAELASANFASPKCLSKSLLYPLASAFRHELGR